MAAKNKVVKKATAKTVTRKKTPYSLPSRSQNITNRYDRLPFKFIDLFAGIGGFRCAMTKLGGKCVFSNEWDKYSTTTYKAWYKDEDVNDNDILIWKNKCHTHTNSIKNRPLLQHNLIQINLQSNNNFFNNIPN